MKRSEQRQWLAWCLAHADVISDADFVFVQAHTKEFKATGNLRKSSVDSLTRIVSRTKHRLDGFDPIKPGQGGAK